MRRLFSWASTRFRRSVSKNKGPRENRRRLYLLEELEPRTLFSADPLVGLIESDVSPDLQPTPAESQAAFSRAFKKHVGVSPAKWRGRTR